jgi:hypothetical protein
MSRTSPRKQSKNNGSSASETAKNVKSLPEYDEGSDFSSLNESPVKPNTDGRRTAKSPAGRALFAAKPATDTKDWIKGMHFSNQRSSAAC